MSQFKKREFAPVIKRKLPTKINQFNLQLKAKTFRAPTQLDRNYLPKNDLVSSVRSFFSFAEGGN